LLFPAFAKDNKVLGYFLLLISEQQSLTEK